MKTYILSRLIQFPLIVAVIYLLTFACIWLAPGDPFSSADRAMDPVALQARKKEFHAESATAFLSHYPLAALRGDFGKSLVKDAFTVNQLIGQRLKVSLTLGFMGLGIAIVVGMTIGTISAVKRDGVLDWAGMSLTLVGISLPSFVVAAGLMLTFVGWLEWFSLSQISRGTSMAALHWDSISAAWQSVYGTFKAFLLPAVALSLAPMAVIVRLQRVSMLDVLGADHVRTARAKGLSKPQVVIKHCLRNAFLPVFTYLGPAAAATLTGSFVVEQIFTVQGLGEEFVKSINSRDATMILAQTMIYSTLLLGLNLLVDLGYAFIDPRIDVTAK